MIPLIIAVYKQPSAALALDKTSVASADNNAAKYFDSMELFSMRGSASDELEVSDLQKFWLLTILPSWCDSRSDFAHI